MKFPRAFRLFTFHRFTCSPFFLFSFLSFIFIHDSSLYFTHRPCSYIFTCEKSRCDDLSPKYSLLSSHSLFHSVILIFTHFHLNHMTTLRLGYLYLSISYSSHTHTLYIKKSVLQAPIRCSIFPQRHREPSDTKVMTCPPP